MAARLLLVHARPCDREQPGRRLMETDFTEKVFANPVVLSLGAPLISACLQFARYHSWEFRSGGQVERVKARGSWILFPTAISQVARSFKQSIRRIFPRPKFAPSRRHAT